MIQKFTFTVDNDAAELQLLDSWLIIQKISANVSFTRYIFTVYIVLPGVYRFLLHDQWSMVAGFFSKTTDASH